MSDMKALIEQLLNQAVKNGDTQVNILNKLSEIEKSNKSDGEKLAAMLKLLGDIKTILQGVADDLKAHFKNDAKVNQYLERMIRCDMKRMKPRIRKLKAETRSKRNSF